MFTDAAFTQQPRETVTLAPSGYERTGSGPENFFWLRDGLSGMVDALANSIVLVDDDARIIARLALPEGFIVGRTEARDDSILLVSGDGGSTIELPRTIDPASPPSLDPQRLAAPRRAALPEAARQGSGQLSLPAQPGRNAASPLDVRSLSGRPLAEATEIGRDSEGRRYVLWSEFVSSAPNIVVRVFVGRYAADGTLTGVAEVPLAEMDYVPDGYATVTGRGELRVIVPTQQALEIRTIPIQPISPVNPERARTIVTPNVLERLETEKGRAISVPSKQKTSGEDQCPANEPLTQREARASVAAEPITRAKVLELANEFLVQQWTLSEKNYEDPSLPNACAKFDGQYWTRPSWIRKELIGQQLTRIPYKWGASTLRACSSSV